MLDQVTTLSCPRIIFPCPLQPTHRSSLLLPNFILALRPDPPPMPTLRPASKLSHPSCLDPFAHDVPSTGHNLLCPWTCLCPTLGCLLDSRQLEKPFWSSVSYRVSFHPAPSPGTPECTYLLGHRGRGCGKAWWGWGRGCGWASLGGSHWMTGSGGGQRRSCGWYAALMTVLRSF